MNLRTIRYTVPIALLLTLALPASQADALRVYQPLGGGTHSQAHGSVPRAPASDAALFGGTLPLVADQGKLGRKLAMVRLYYNLGQNFSTNNSRQVMSAGSTVLASLDVPSNGPSYASIAAGKHDAAVRSWLTQAEQQAVAHHLPAVYVSFQHEANSPAKRPLGSPAQFAAAWRHIHALAARAHLNWHAGGRLHWALILEHLAYFTPRERPRWSLALGMAASYWPGAGTVDVVAADGYNRGGCRNHDGTTSPSEPSVPPGSLFNPVLAWAAAHGGLPVFLAEWASASYTAEPGWQPRFIDQMKGYVLAHPRIEAALYWDQQGYNACSYSLAGHPLALAALAALGRALHGRGTG
ncbi:MAG TPA: hypothetical protein VGL63_04010 [Streptosporangiaceae bacterium]